MKLSEKQLKILDDSEEEHPSEVAFIRLMNMCNVYQNQKISDLIVHMEDKNDRNNIE